MGRKIDWEPVTAAVVPQINAEGVHVWTGDACLPADVRYFSLCGKAKMRMNRHSFFEVAYACSGMLELQVQDRLFQVQRGELMVLGGSLYHRMIHPPHGHARIVALYFEPELIRRSTEKGEGNEYLAPFLLQSADFPHVIPATTGIPLEVLKVMQRIHGEIPAHSARARLAVKTYLKMILMLLVNHYAGITGTQEIFLRRQLDLERLRPLFEYLESHYSQSMRVREAARIAAMSESHFMWFFKRVTGQSFLAYVNHFRIAKAQLLLATSNKSVCEISQEAGFCDQSHFGVVFREMVGMTPLAYRRHSDEAPYRPVEMQVVPSTEALPQAG